MRKRRFGFSIQVIHPNGAPAPVGWRRGLGKAIDLADETAKGTGLEARVWNTRTATCVHTAPSAAYREVA